MRRPFAASASPAVGVLFSAAQATTHAPQPVHRSMSITIAHLCFIALVLPFINAVNTESVDAPHPGANICKTVRQRDECKALAGKASDRRRIVNTPREGNDAGADAAALECERIYESEH